MSDTKYNGWTNYATWRIKLEVLDNIEENIKENDQKWEDIGQLKKYLAEYVDEVITKYDGDSEETGLAIDYARAFVNQVNWHEIAEHILEDLRTGYDYEALEQ
jgi:hemerythrin-like domain-containing protein